MTRGVRTEGEQDGEKEVPLAEKGNMEVAGDRGEKQVCRRGFPTLAPQALIRFYPWGALDDLEEHRQDPVSGDEVIPGRLQAESPQETVLP